MLKKMKLLFLYGELSREDFHSILPAIRKQNLRDLRAYCIIVSVILAGSIIAVLFSTTFTLTTAFVYFLGLVFSLLLFFLAGHTGRLIRLQNSLKFLFIGAVYAIGILITMVQPESLAVAFMVLLVLAPLLFSSRPIVIAGFTLAAVLLFSVCEVCLKAPALVTVDIWNAITYGLLGILVGTIIQRVRLQNLTQLREIAMLSESDLLTGLKNRNSFEQNPIVYGNTPAKDITCIYADVNGLHELNNTQGHEAGDAMLQTVANAILGQFGRDHSYRVGGDEFVVFSFGLTPEEAQQKIDEMDSACRAKGYYVSFGFACGNDASCDIDSLVRSAEQQMYRAKAEYYRTHDRRKR